MKKYKDVEGFIMTYQRQHPDPVFMFGALRSGTTLLRLMLTSHSQIHSPGEADYLFDHLIHSPSAPGSWLCDREALADDWKFRLAGITLPDGQEGSDLVYSLNDLIHERATGKLVTVSIHRNAQAVSSLFPKAKYIHLLRDPRDTARSAVSMGWDGNSYYGVRHWLDTEMNWKLAGIPEDQVLTVRFEELIKDVPKGLSEICDFLQLEFEPNMLLYHKDSTYGPPDPTMSHKWQSQVSSREVARIEGKVGSLLQDRGYRPFGEPVTPGVIESVWLKIDNKLRRWQYNIRRYGLRLFMLHHLARMFRLRRLTNHFAERQLKIKIQNLK